MNTTTYVAATAAVVVAGRWANGKGVDIRIAIGAGGYAIGLSVVNTQNSEIATKLAILVLLTTAFIYVPEIVKKTNITAPRKKGS